MPIELGIGLNNKCSTGVKDLEYANHFDSHSPVLGGELKRSSSKLLLKGNAVYKSWFEVKKPI